MAHKHKEIDKALREWRQGDLALKEKEFTYVADPSSPLTAESREVKDKKSLQAVTKEVDGLVVVTQSCDIARSCEERPFIEVSPLAKVEGVTSGGEDAERALEMVKKALDHVTPLFLQLQNIPWWLISTAL